MFKLPCCPVPVPALREQFIRDLYAAGYKRVDYDLEEGVTAMLESIAAKEFTYMYVETSSGNRYIWGLTTEQYLEQSTHYLLLNSHRHLLARLRAPAP